MFFTLAFGSRSSRQPSLSALSERRAKMGTKRTNTSRGEKKRNTTNRTLAEL
jgi:hypothetical protein